MPRGKVPAMFHHSVKWAPSDPNVNQTYGARVQSVGLKRGKIEITWSIFTAYSRKPKKTRGKSRDPVHGEAKTTGQKGKAL